PPARGGGRQPVVRLHLLGPLRVGVARRAPYRLTGRLAEILGFMALRGGGATPVGRDAAAFALWPDLREDAARRALAAALYRLRRAVPGSGAWLVACRHSVVLRDAWVDVDAFTTLAASRDPDDWRAALDLYVGDLLPEVDAEWADEPRAALRDRAAGLLAAMTAEREAAGEAAEALAWARR